MKHTLVISGTIVLALAAAFISWLFYEPYVSTEYPTHFNKQQFGLIRTNLGVDEVYRLVGPPLFLQVNPDVAGTGAYRQTRDYVVKLEHVRELLTRANTEVYMEFSSPKRAGGNYFLYYVDFANGKVISYAGPVRMD